ncbi:hypothetical protein [Leuconostoc suionicum]|uniref:hypothetical protein n=1 Tax=Leuconostoc suionicum TaxID=1511761 RepID=UPI0032E00738
MTKDYFYELEQTLLANNIDLKSDDTMIVGKPVWQYQKFDFFKNILDINKRKLINDNLIYARGITDDGKNIVSTGEASLRETIKSKFKPSHDNWNRYAEQLIQHARQAENAQEFGDWFINETFKTHMPELHTIIVDKEVIIYVSAGVHRLAMLDWIQYNGFVNKKFFPK